MNNRKKIIVVTRAMTAGGAERVIAQLVNYLIEQGKECEIITTDKSGVAYELNPNVIVREIGKKSNNKVVDRLARYSELRKMIKADKPDVVLTMPEDTGIYVILALLGTGYPVYVSERNNPWVMPDVKITRFLRKIAYPFVKGVIFQTEMAKSFFPKYIQRKSVVLQNPVDGNRIPLPYEGKREKVIIAAGRLEKQKNFDLLIRAFARFSGEHPEYELYIYGEGQLRRELEKLVKTVEMDGKVHMPGIKKNLLELINSAEMFVLSSNYEGMPNVLIEAMCMGMPVISTDCPCGGPRMLIKNNENGILVSVNNEEQLVEAMEKMIDLDFNKKMSEAAKEIRKKMTDNQIFVEWQEFLFQ